MDKNIANFCFRTWVEELLAEFKKQGKSFEFIDNSKPANPYRISVSERGIFAQPLSDLTSPTDHSSTNIQGEILIRKACNKEQKTCVVFKMSEVGDGVE